MNFYIRVTGALDRINWAERKKKTEENNKHDAACLTKELGRNENKKRI